MQYGFEFIGRKIHKLIAILIALPFLILTDIYVYFRDRVIYISEYYDEYFKKGKKNDETDIL